MFYETGALQKEFCGNKFAVEKKLHTIYTRRNIGDILRKLKFLGAIVLAGVLLPYIITIFFVGNRSALLIEAGEEEQKIQLQVGQTVREMTEEEYLLGALAAVIPMNYERETLKAMTIILRTNLRILQQEHEIIPIPSGEFLEEHARAKAWGVGTYVEYEKAGKEVISETEGQVLKSGDTLIQGVYHKVSAGETRGASAEYPYLKSVESSQDRQSEQYLTITWVEDVQLKEVFPNVMEEQMQQIMFVTEGESSYIREVHIGEMIISGEEFRKKLALCSSAYFGSWQDSGLQIVCKGQGHGFGFSCYGANEMAKEGKDYKELISSYYNEVSVVEE